MSQAKYSKLWQRTQLKLNRLIGIEFPKEPKDLPESRELCFEELSGRYVKYSLIYKDLQRCLDHCTQPQKRILLEKVLEEVTGRVIEMRYELERLCVSEYVNLVDTCFDLKIPVESLELSLGKTFTMKKMQNIHQRLVLLDYIVHTTTMDDNDDAAATFVCTVGESVLIIQREQRAYGARLRFKNLKRLIELKKKLETRGSRKLEDHIKGIIQFQSLWRGYAVRRTLNDLKTGLDEFIGMEMPVDMDKNLMDLKKQVIETKDYNKAMDREVEYRENYILKMEEFMENEAPKFRDQLIYEIRQWLLECYDMLGAFPPFPSEEDGGSIVMMYADKTVEDLEYDLNGDGFFPDPTKGLKGKKGAKKKGGGKDKKEKKEKGKKGEPGDGFSLNPSNFLTDDEGVGAGIVACCQEYNDYWMDRDEDELVRTGAVYDDNLLLEQIVLDSEEVIRKQVDELMRLELEKLEAGISRSKPPKPKPKKPKKEKEKKKKKKGVDLTEGVPLESLFKELVLAGVVKKVPTANLKDFIGELNLMCASDSSRMEFKHDLGDVRKMIFDYAVLPMTSSNIHARAPLRKSMMIVGPHGSGKKMLVHAICNEVGANLFDLSPANISDIYTDAEGQKRLIHLVMKVAKQMEPSVIWIDNCDRMFTKKLPPEDDTRPGRLKKDLTKALKTITPDDRILLIGTARAPFKAAVGPMFKMYERLVFVYPPSSKSRYSLWKRFITDNKGIIPKFGFELSPLTHVSSGYTAGDIKNAVMEVLTEKRVMRQSVAPLKGEEFVNRLATFDPVFVEELDTFEKWLLKTPLKKKLGIVHELEAEGLDVMGVL